MTTLSLPVGGKNRYGQRCGRGRLGLAAVSTAIGVGLLAALLGLRSPAGLAVVALLAGVMGILLTSVVVEGRRMAADRFAAVAAWTALLLALAPLVAVLGYTIARGVARLDGTFLTHSMAGVGPLAAGGGAYHAIIGTLEQVALASLIAVPVGLAAAIYLVEYGHGRLPALIRFTVDVMTGIPSIVAGLFIFAAWVLALHQGFSGFAAALSLAILMVPVVVRTTEEFLLLVPMSLREASYALGVAKWRTVVSIVLPSARTGLVTGVMLAVARITGETAPLLLTTFFNNFIHLNPFHGEQSALPLYVFQQAGSAFAVDIQRAWTGALTLIGIVVVLYLLARLLTWRGAPAGR